MKKFTFALLCAAVAFASVGTMAQDEMGKDESMDSDPHPYYDCGLGAMIFSDNEVAAAISNVIFDLGTTAYTSATSSPETCKGEGVEMAVFIQHSYDRLIEETAQGEGEHINAMLNIYGCATEARPQVVSDVRRAAGKAVTDAGYATQSRMDKVIQYYQIVNSAASNHCSAS